MHLPDGTPAWEVIGKTSEVLHPGYTGVAVRNHHRGGESTVWQIPNDRLTPERGFSKFDDAPILPKTMDLWNAVDKERLQPGAVV